MNKAEQLAEREYPEMGFEITDQNIKHLRRGFIKGYNAKQKEMDGVRAESVGGMKHYLTFDFIDGKKQNPIDDDFHITPCLTYGYAKKDNKTGRAIALEWGYWAVSLAIITINTPSGDK